MNFTFFWRNKSPFSNWHPSKFTVGDIEYSHGEQYMMYAKAMLFDDLETAQKILDSKSPVDQKAFGRAVRNYVEEVWVANRIEIMVLGLYAKFSQNEHLKKALLDTGDTEIAEASPVDSIWGIGLAEDDPRAQDKATWKGQNLLGIVLMRVRDELRRTV